MGLESLEQGIVAGVADMQLAYMEYRRSAARMMSTTTTTTTMGLWPILVLVERSQERTID
jgi:hypothetical protein